MPVFENLEPLARVSEPLPRNLEPLRGTLIHQFIRCGRHNCQCQRGPLHGPYFYRIWREGGKVCKVYVKKTDALAVLAQTARYRVLETQLNAMITFRKVISKRLAQQRSTLRLMQHSRPWPSPTSSRIPKPKLSLTPE